MNDWMLGFLSAWAIVGLLMFLSVRFGAFGETESRRRFRLLHTLDEAETPLPLHVLVRLGGDRPRDYSTITSLQREDLIGAQWTSAEHKSRIFYLKPKGRQWLDERRKEQV